MGFEQKARSSARWHSRPGYCCCVDGHVANVFMQHGSITRWFLPLFHSYVGCRSLRVSLSQSFLRNPRLSVLQKLNRSSVGGNVCVIRQSDLCASDRAVCVPSLIRRTHSRRRDLLT